MPRQGTKGRDGVGGRGETATHSGRDGAGREKKKKKPPKKKKRKSPQRKKPPTKKEKTLLAAPLAYGRLRRPPLLLLSPSCLFLWRLRRPTPPLLASLSSCGRLRRPSSLLLLSRFFRAAAPPYPFRFSSSSPRFFGGCAASLSPALSWAAGAAPHLSLSLLSIKQLTNP